MGGSTLSIEDQHGGWQRVRGEVPEEQIRKIAKIAKIAEIERQQAKAKPISPQIYADSHR